MENPKQHIKSIWLKQHAKVPSPKIVQEILEHADKSYAFDKTTPLETYVAWWAKTYASKSKIVKGKFVYYHVDISETPVFPERTLVKRKSAEKKSEIKNNPWWKKTLKAVSLFVLFLVIFILVLALLVKALGQAIPDQVRQDDSDLQYSAITISSEENAYPELIKAAEAYDLAISVKESDAGTAKEEAFQHFRAAAGKYFYLSPLSAVSSQNTSVYDELPPYREIRTLAIEMGQNAIDLVKDGKDNDALDEALRIVRVGNLLQHAPRGALIDYLVAIGIKTTGLKTVSAVVTDGRFTPKERVAYAAELEKLGSDGSEILPFWKGTYTVENAIIAIIANGEVTHVNAVSYGAEYHPNALELLSEFFHRYPSFYFYPNETHNLLAVAARKQMEYAVLPCDAVLSQQPLIPQNSSAFQRLFMRNSSGKQFIDEFYSLSSVKNWSCMEQDLFQQAHQLILGDTVKE